MSVVLEASLEGKQGIKIRKYLIFEDGPQSSPPDIERDESDADPHDDKERLESHVVTDGLHSHSLHQGHVVVLLQKSHC